MNSKLDEISIEQCSTPDDIVQYLCHYGQKHDDFSQFGTFSPSIYDSAWLSMVYREHEGQLTWLFPQCFQYVVSSQLKDGSWPAYVSTVDGILNTSASLLALLTRKGLEGDLSSESVHISERIDRAKAGLQSLLQRWNVAETDRVGFEVIVPGLLRQISSRFDIEFSFPGQSLLEELNVRKLKKIRPEILYSKHETTLLHSLEAVAGVVDYDQMRHHCSEERGILGSPASTASYLMGCSTWDTRAELYLRRVVENAGNKAGGVPSGYPTCMFELSWALSTIFVSNGAPKGSTLENLQQLKRFFRDVLAKQKGVTGFVPGLLADADDTARVLMTLGFLGDDVDLTPMVSTFQSGPYFKTYELERNPSFSANCNVLLTLTEAKDLQLYIREIESLTTYLLGLWRSENITDKWNFSSRYSFMLLSSAFIRLLQRYDKGDLVGVQESLISRDIPLCLCQILSRVLSQQKDNGSWENSLEVTAYSVLTITQMMHLPFHQDLRHYRLEPAASRGCSYIMAHQDEPAEPCSQDYLWIEKLAYVPVFLRKVYSVAAIHASREQLTWTKEIRGHFQIPIKASKMKLLLQSIPLVKQSSEISMDLALLEAFHWSKYLHEFKHMIFPGVEENSGRDKYLELIPASFTICNQLGKTPISPNAIWDMILLSLLIYQIDEFMESIVIRLSETSLRILERQLRAKCGLETSGPGNSAGMRSVSSPSPELQMEDAEASNDGGGEYPESENMDSIVQILGRFIDHVLDHPKVGEAPQSAQMELAEELYSFLLAHISHISDNTRLKADREYQKNGSVQDHYWSKAGYFKWVRSVGADDTSCPVSALFFMCLISQPGQYCFQDCQSKYMSRSLVRHLSTMCRQYNDYGSVSRDMDEGNLNSLHFAEFSKQSPTNSSQGLSMKDQLLEIAEFERSCMELALQRLMQESTSNDAAERFKMFVNVTDLYGQVYVQRDLTNRIHR